MLAINQFPCNFCKQEIFDDFRQKFHLHFNASNLTPFFSSKDGTLDYDKAIELDPNLAEAYFNRGLTQIFLGNNKQGISDLSKAGELGVVSAYNVIKRFTDVPE